MVVLPWLGDLFATTCSFCFSLFPTFVDDFNVVVKDCCNDRHHVGFHNSRPNAFGPAYSNIHNALECQIPLPHLHHLLTSTLLQYTY